MSDCAPYKAEKTNSYTCGNCMKVFHIAKRRSLDAPVFRCPLCPRKYTMSNQGPSILDNPYAVKA